MRTDTSEKRSVEMSMAWLHVPLMALIIFILRASMSLRVALFIVASAILVAVMWPTAGVRDDAMSSEPNE